MKSAQSNRALGIQGEQAVIRTLQQHGFMVLAHNYQRPVGEIDIIAQKADVIAFVEVKTRLRPLFDMSELISYTKQQRIIAAAHYYCAEHAIINQVCRFDVALVAYVATTPTITIIENAFTQRAL